MCISKSKLAEVTKTYHELTVMKKELEAELDAMKVQIIDYMKTNNLEKEFTPTNQISYISRNRSSYSEALLKAALHTNDLKQYKTASSYMVLTVK